MATRNGGWIPLVVLAATTAGAQITPSGDEFQVNSFTTSAQQRPSVAADAAGDFVVVWQSLGSGGSDTSSLSVEGQRFDPAGLSLGGEFQVNTYTTAAQQYPAVAANVNGNFLVTWASLGSLGTDTSDESVQGQRYDPNGLPLGDQFQVNTYTTNGQRRSALAFDALGNVVVVWGGLGSSGLDASLESIHAQRYDASGLPLGVELEVNTYTTSHQARPAVAADAAGNFVVVWQSDGSFGSDNPSYSIQGQRFDADGNPVGGQFQVNTYTSNNQKNPTVAVSAGGNFVVVWGSLGSSGSDNSLSSIQGQRYDAYGIPVGGEFQVNTSTVGYQRYPSVTGDADGDFVVAWQSDSSSGSDNSGVSIQAQHFAADGTPLGDETQVNTYTTGNQQLPALTSDRGGHLVVAWQSSGSGGTDSDSDSIQAQRFDVLLPFLDGFETGGTGRWSSTVP